jgi:hypothetical protein
MQEFFNGIGGLHPLKHHQTNSNVSPARFLEDFSRNNQSVFLHSQQLLHALRNHPTSNLLVVIKKLWCEAVLHPKEAFSIV